MLLGRAFQNAEGFATEARHVLPDGSQAWVRLNVAPVLEQGGAVRHLVVAAEDVTARRHAEDELQKEVEERTATLKTASEVLHTEVEQRKRVEDALKLDIAERRKAQEALMESEWRFRLVIQGVTDYAIFMLDTDGNITHWNMGAQRIHQYTAAEIAGQHFSRFYTEEERQRGEPARALQVAAYEGKHAVEGRRVRRDESEFWAGVVIEAIRDEVGTLVGFANITRDITERREAQASLERAQEQLAQSQKMEALGQLTGSIAHDFNNLLMIVSGHAQLLRRRLTDPKHLQAIEAVHSAANRGESLTRQLLAFSRRQPLNPVVADLKERIAAVHEMLVGSLRGNVELKCDISEDVWPVEVDVAELELALVNVAVNARDAMPGGGSITLSARNVTLKKSDGVDQLEGDFVALAMTDTGVGIAPDVLPRIFEPFFTTKALGKGTGLGLSQVYGFSHQSGGTVAATSNVGSGTAITIYLPRKHAALAKAAEAPATQVTGGGAGHHPRGRGQSRGRRRHRLPGRAARLPDLARGERRRRAQPSAARRQDRSRVQRRGHARRHERHGARAGDRQPLSAASASAHQRLQRRGADGGIAVPDPAQAVPAPRPGEGHPRGAGTRRRCPRGGRPRAAVPARARRGQARRDIAFLPRQFGASAGRPDQLDSGPSAA